MKKLIFLIVLVALSNHSLISAQESKKGIYLSNKDYEKGNLSFLSKPGNSTVKIRKAQSPIFNHIIVIQDGKKTPLNKDSIFGYRDRNGINYRYYLGSDYEILNSMDSIIIYKKMQVVGLPKHPHLVPAYFVSKGASSEIYSLSRTNLKMLFFDNIRFIQLLDIYFSSDNELISNATNDHASLLNWVLNQSYKECFSSNTIKK